MPWTSSSTGPEPASMKFIACRGPRGPGLASATLSRVGFACHERRYPPGRSGYRERGGLATGSNTVAPVADAPQGPDANRPPRGALIVIAIGLLACAVAALATTGKGEGEAANLEWVQSAEGPDSKPVHVPGGRETMQLTDSNISATGTNVSGYSLYLVASSLTVSAGSPIGDGRILCRIKAPKGPKSPRAAAACGRPTRAPPKTASTARKCRKRC